MTESTRPANSYPLSALFVLIAICSILTAMINPVARAISADQTSILQTTLAAIAVACVGLTVGLAIGLYHHRRMRGALMGMSVGIAVGVISGLLMLSPITAFPTLFGLSILGSMILVLTGFLLGFRQSSP
jgi:hypothetical protein